METEFAPPHSMAVDEAQTPFSVRFDWGEAGLRALAAGAAVAVVVDVLTFSTAVVVAVGRGAEVRPFRWRQSAAEAAREWDAHLAVPRQAIGPEQPFSLSPVSLLALRAGERLLLPSPNGSHLCALAAERYPHVLAGCVRNASAAARAARSLAGGRPIVVIAAGERRPEAHEILRPAFEDLVGAGAILAALADVAVAPEALAAIGAFRAVERELPKRLAESVSGRELGDAGYAEDVAIAATLDAESVAPLLVDGVFRPFDRAVAG
jgi:2-phosphosulfolactate phosphatase